MSPKDPLPSSKELDENEASVWRGIVEMLLAQGDTISDAMRLADGLLLARRAQRREKMARRARSGTIPISRPHAIPEQPSKLPPSLARVSTLRVPTR
jgi:hypothetical protein